MTAPAPADADERIPIGSVLDGRYRIDGVLGTGGMGRVYRGEHTGIGRAVAIKVLHADLAKNREAAARFQREALASGRLDHANIVGVSDVGVLDDGSCYLVMEVLEGESLGDRISRDKRIGWREALDILRGVLAGLRHAHDRGVVHRDIKPDNVYLARKDGASVVKILDFGIAKLYAGSPDDPASTRAGLTVGTPAYLSPEQAVGGEITPASDIYSATVVLYEMISGRAPFEDKDPLAMLGAHVSRPVPPLAEIAAGVEVPAALEDIMSRGLAKTPSQRISSAVEYLALLDGLAPAGSGVIATPLPFPAIAEPPADVLGVMPTASLTPVPAPTDGFAVGSPATPLPLAAQPVTLGDATPPIPKRWIQIGAIVVGAAIVLGIVAAIAGGSKAAKPAAAPPPKSEARTEVKPARTEVKPAAAVPVPVPVPVPAEPDPDMQLKALLHDLEDGPTCAARRSVIAKLVALGDARAVPPLRRAKYRMVGGVVGIGADNANACLTADAERAIKQLGRASPSPK
ncbi:MAG TPA: serine/threonine-protein kinase [Kofleriaceae bacterium]|jgi:serine/threonine-protein kinase